MIPYNKIDNSWTIFLDRDGVINHEKYLDYIHVWEEFRFYDGAIEAMKLLSDVFGKMIIVTNQRGVGKGLTKVEELHRIHHNMSAAVVEAGGKIDAVYYCGDMDNNSPNRKPNPGMGHQAMHQFPDIIPGKSVMVGNTLSDMEFGRNFGSFTVFLPTTRPEVNTNDERIDDVFPSLIQFARHLIDNR